MRLPMKCSLLLLVTLAPLLSFSATILAQESASSVESIAAQRTRGIADEAYESAGITYYSNRAIAPQGPHVAVFIHAITEYIIKELHDKLPRRGLLVLEEMLDEIKDSGLLEAADRIYISMLGAVLFESWFDEAVHIINRFNDRSKGVRAKVVFLMDDVEIEDGSVGYVYWGTCFIIIGVFVAIANTFGPLFKVEHYEP
jgi:hypothetical protein